MNDILEFYKGKKPNQVGMYFDDIMEMSNEELESDHHYIQWLFPLKEKSMAVPDAPVINDMELLIIQSYWDGNKDNDLARIMLNFLNSFSKMMKFYGIGRSIEKDEDGNTISVISKMDNFEERSKVWLTVRNHNFLRLTRMLTSLRLIDRGSDAKKLHICLCKIYEENKGVIGPLTKQFWDEAMKEDND